MKYTYDQEQDIEKELCDLGKAYISFYELNAKEHALETFTISMLEKLVHRVKSCEPVSSEELYFFDNILRHNSIRDLAYLFSKDSSSETLQEYLTVYYCLEYLLFFIVFLEA